MIRRIEAESRWCVEEEGIEEINPLDDFSSLRDLLEGHSVVEVTEDHLKLDNGTVLRVMPNEGCGGCTSGSYSITHLVAAPNIITSVSTSSYSSIGDYYSRETVYSIFVVVEEKTLNLLEVAGTDGNGYYGTGYTILVRKA